MSRFLKLEDKGANNINLVTPTHYADKIITALKNAKMHKPVVWNSSGYERAQTIEKLRGLVDVFLLDCKYYDNKIAIKYSPRLIISNTSKAKVLKVVKPPHNPIVIAHFTFSGIL